eukprot:3087033-Pleurochrysis_carterae.AAC.1
MRTIPTPSTRPATRNPAANGFDACVSTSNANNNSGTSNAHTNETPYGSLGLELSAARPTARVARHRDEVPAIVLEELRRRVRLCLDTGRTHFELFDCY